MDNIVTPVNVTAHEKLLREAEYDIKIKGKIRPCHHISVDHEIKEDCKMLLNFLSDL